MIYNLDQYEKHVLFVVYYWDVGLWMRCWSNKTKSYNASRITDRFKLYINSNLNVYNTVYRSSILLLKYGITTLQPLRTFETYVYLGNFTDCKWKPYLFVRRPVKENSLNGENIQSCWTDIIGRPLYNPSIIPLRKFSRTCGVVMESLWLWELWLYYLYVKRGR